jgi:citrate lyase beta subunit
MNQPVHTLYGGAHLFRSDICRRMGELALRALAEHGQDFSSIFEVSEPVRDRVIEKLRREPVEDLRIDFEDGYGVRSDEEEDAAAARVSEQLARGRDEKTLPRFIGIRIKALTDESRSRSLRTLALVLKDLNPLPSNFTITLPKITEVGQVRRCVDAIEEFGVNRLELMIETPQSVLLLPQLIEASRGLCVGAHFGAYDYTAALGIAAPHQDMLHPACDFARSMMQLHVAGTSVNISDGATNILPIGDVEAVRHGWRVHYKYVRRSLENGFYQSWDLHPAQLVSRYAAVYSFFLEGLDASAARLKNFIEKSAQATRVGGVFDDAATGQGLLNYFLRAIDCGAISEPEVAARTGLTLQQLRRSMHA